MIELTKREIRVVVNAPPVTVHPPSVTVPVTIEQETTKAATPVVHVDVHVPDEIRTIPVETETVSERGRDGLVKRSVTRPTGVE